MPAFECQKCGRCCEGHGGIVLTGRDLARLAKSLGLSKAEFCAFYAERHGGKLSARAGDDGYCVFYRTGVGCSVHQARPDICRAWPFFKGNLEDKDSLVMAAAYCPGINTASGHEEFRRQGLEYLRANALIADKHDKTAPNALKIKNNAD